MSAYRLVKLLFFGGLALLAVSLYLRHATPPPARLDQALHAEPMQKAANQPAFTATAGGVEYSVKPLYEYELTGLVVTAHDSQTWWDSIHAEWNDHLNIIDLCVVWGDNARSGVYQDIRFSSGQFWCYWETSSSQAASTFNPNAYANNHLLTADPALAKRMRQVRVGDQVRFKGKLAEYSHSGGFKRGTSTVRTDQGDGACETVFIEEFEIIQRSGGPWRTLVYVALALILLSMVIWYKLPVNAGDGA
jgi:hypothetical protein